MAIAATIGGNRRILMASLLWLPGPWGDDFGRAVSSDELDAMIEARKNPPESPHQAAIAKPSRRRSSVSTKDKTPPVPALAPVVVTPEPAA
jgi:hypothetical protein